MKSRFFGAALRMALVMILVAMPSYLLDGSGNDTGQMVALVALLAGALTFVEYRSESPSLVEFRDAPPFNRLRFLMLFSTVVLVSVVTLEPAAQGSLPYYVQMAGAYVGSALDFPYSPIRIATVIGASGTTADTQNVLRDAVGIAYLISLVCLIVFIAFVRLGQWPRQQNSFNVWVNLPTFDPTHGADVMARLYRDARFNVALGFLLPFVAPAFFHIAFGGFEPIVLTASQSLVWAVTAWSFLPASLFMRGVAMAQVADMIRATRAANRMATVDRGFATA